MARNDPQVNFRIPSELKAKLDQAAQENGRTLTAELILRLEMTFDHDDKLDDLIGRIEWLENEVDSLRGDQGQLRDEVNYLNSRPY